MEEEVRRILGRAVSAPARMGQFSKECFEGIGAELELPERPPHQPISFAE